MSPEETAWLAGLLEGEGSFNVEKGRGAYTSPRIQVRMNDRDIVERVARMFGGAAITTYVRREPHHHDSYQCKITGWPAMDIMSLVRPHMGERRGRRIDELLEMYRERPRKGARRTKG